MRNNRVQGTRRDLSHTHAGNGIRDENAPPQDPTIGLCLGSWAWANKGHGKSGKGKDRSHAHAGHGVREGARVNCVHQVEWTAEAKSKALKEKEGMQEKEGTFPMPMREMGFGKVRDTTSSGDAATPGGCICSRVRLYEEGRCFAVPRRARI